MQTSQIITFHIVLTPRFSSSKIVILEILRIFWLNIKKKLEGHTPKVKKQTSSSASAA